MPRAPACEAFVHNDVVFAGQVVSVEPDFEPWFSYTARRVNQRFSDEEWERLKNDNSPDALKELRDAYAEIVPAPYKSQVAAATSRTSLEAILTAITGNGKRFRFHVDEMFKGPKGDRIDVWTDFSDCAAPLEKGETYLVYAHRDGKGRFETSVCSRTRRLTDSGEDLAYLQFLKFGGTASARVYGWVTTDQSDLKEPRLWNDVTAPGADLILRLDFSGGSRFSGTDDKGTFAFDRLPAGEYTLSVFGEHYFEEMRPQPLIAPRHVTVAGGGCAVELIYVPRALIPLR